MRARPDETIPSAVRRTAVPAALFLGFLLLYGLTRDNAYPFDALLTALTIRRPVFDGPLASLLSWNHFLWLPAARAFFLALKGLGTGADTYAAIEWWNAGAGATLLALLYVFLRRFIHYGWALGAVLLAGFSHTIWLRASSGDPYLTGTLLAAGACLAITPRALHGVKTFPAAAGALIVLSGYMHIGNLVLLPAAALAAWGGRGKDGIKDALTLVLTAGLMLLPYLLFYGLFTPAGIAEWLAWGSGQVNGHAPGASASGQFRLNLFSNLPVIFSTLTRSLAALPAGGTAAKWLAALPAMALCAWSFRRAYMDRPLPAHSVPALSFFAAITLLFSFWIPGNIFYWAGPLLFLILSGGLAFSSRLQRPPGVAVSSAAAVVFLALAANNFLSVIRPAMSGPENPQEIRLCEGLRRATPEGSVVMISGIYSGYLKVAIPYFAERKTLSLDLIFIQHFGTGIDPLSLLAKRLDAALLAGVPVYMLGDVLEAQSEYGDWGISPERMQSFLNSYRLEQATVLAPEPPGTLYRIHLK